MKNRAKKISIKEFLHRMKSEQAEPSKEIFSIVNFKNQFAIERPIDGILGDDESIILGDITIFLENVVCIWYWETEFNTMKYQIEFDDPDDGQVILVLVKLKEFMDEHPLQRFLEKGERRTFWTEPFHVKDNEAMASIASTFRANLHERQDGSFIMYDKYDDFIERFDSQEDNINLFQQIIDDGEVVILYSLTLSVQKDEYFKDLYSEYMIEPTVYLFSQNKVKTFSMYELIKSRLRGML